jgi:hypothetical protein
MSDSHDSVTPQTPAIPRGFYVSNSPDEDVFDVTTDGIYFRKATGTQWYRTDQWNFDHLCDMETVNATQGASVDVNTHDERGLEVKVTAHVGVTLSDVVKWTYVSPDGNQATIWAGPSGGPGEGVSLDVGVWYDKHGDVHMKIAEGGIIPHLDFGADVVINPKTIQALTKPTAEDKAFSKGFVQGITLGIASNPPPVLTKAVATVHKVANDIDNWLK